MKKGERSPEQQEKFEIVKRLLAAGGYSGRRIAEIADITGVTFTKYKRILGYEIERRGRPSGLKCGRVQRQFPVPPRVSFLRDELTKAFLAGDLEMHGKLCLELQRELTSLKRSSLKRSLVVLEAAE